MSLQELNLNSTKLFEELDEKQDEVLMGGGVVYEIEVKNKQLWATEWDNIGVFPSRN